MPDKPTWCGHLEEAIEGLRGLPQPWVDRALLQDLLGVGPRRAQQILAPCVSRRIGANGLADREAVIARLKQLAAGEISHYEHQRRQRLAAYLDALYRERRNSVFVAAPARIVNQQLQGLPPGVSISPGRIRIDFASVPDALQKLLALAMAIRNDELLFERLAMGAK